MDNRGLSTELETMLPQAVEEAAENPIDLKSDPHAAVWNGAYRRFSSNPKPSETTMPDFMPLSRTAQEWLEHSGTM